MKKSLLIFAMIFPIIAMMTGCACTTVEAGHVGVPIHLGAVGDHVLEEGFHFKNPLTTSVAHLDARVQKLSVSATATSSDLQTVTSTIALNYRIDSTKALRLYQDIGVEYRKTIISPLLQEAIKTVTAQYTAEELITSRPEVKAKIFEIIKKNLFQSHIIVTDLSVENFKFSDAYDDAIERKQVAEQLAKQAKNDLTRIQVEAEQKKAQAEGEAAALLARATAEAKALELQRSVLTPELLQLRWIEKWDGKMPSVQSGESVMMLKTP